MIKEGAGARGIIGPLEGCFCLSHWKALMLLGLIGSNMARGWLARVSRDESSRASPREEVESAGAEAGLPVHPTSAHCLWVTLPTSLGLFP